MCALVHVLMVVGSLVGYFQAAVKRGLHCVAC